MLRNFGCSGAPRRTCVLRIGRYRSYNRANICARARSPPACPGSGAAALPISYTSIIQSRPNPRRAAAFTENR